MSFITVLTSTIQSIGADIKSLITSVNSKQANLVSGTNIKTVNTGSVLGAGNVNTKTPIALPSTDLDALTTPGEYSINQTLTWNSGSNSTSGWSDFTQKNGLLNVSGTGSIVTQTITYFYTAQEGEPVGNTRPWVSIRSGSYDATNGWEWGSFQDFDPVWIIEFINDINTTVGSAASIYFGPSAPTGDESFWFHTDNMTMLVKYNDGNSIQWVEFSASILGSVVNALTILVGTADPNNGGGVDGQNYFKKAGQLYQKVNGAWQFTGIRFTDRDDFDAAVSELKGVTPLVPTGALALTAAHRGVSVFTSYNLTLSNTDVASLLPGHVTTIKNSSGSNITLTPSGGQAIRIVGSATTSTGARTIAPYTVALLSLEPNGEIWLGGSGVT